jgi:hypothetical protein
MRRRSILASFIILFALSVAGVGPISAQEPGDLEVDTWTEVTFDVFTVDRIYLNRYGGITAEGRIACSPVDIAPDDGIYAGVWWTALQYAGRKTALTATAEMARAFECWTPQSDAVRPWTTVLRITPQDGVQWVYSLDGRFGTGPIYIDAQANAGYTVVRQHVDPAGTDAPYAPGCEDTNGDGYCVAEVLFNSLSQVNLRPIRVR